MLSSIKKTNLNKIALMVVKRPTVSSERRNKIEEDLESILKPLNIMQSLFICAKYSIRNRIITHNSKLYNALRVFCTCIYSCIYLYRMISQDHQTINKSWRKFWFGMAWIAGFILYMVGDLINTISNIKHSHKNILLVLKIQHVLSILRISGTDLRIFVCYSWASVIILNIFSISYVICYCFTTNIIIFEIISAYTSIAHDINIAYAIILMKLNEKMVRVFMEELESSKCDDSKIEEYWNRMLNMYLNILEIYNIIWKTFQQMLVLLPLMAQIWNAKNMVVLMCLSTECERFYTAMKDVETACTKIFKSRNCSVHLTRVCKNIQRGQNTYFKKMNACGFFYIDVHLPVMLSSFI
ncbi:hypothetical protein B5X24_HaOG201014, partial [Helicoverpa armigera]